MILLEDVLLLHKLSIEKYGGSEGIRDIGLLESFGEIVKWLRENTNEM